MKKIKNDEVSEEKVNDKQEKSDEVLEENINKNVKELNEKFLILILLKQIKLNMKKKHLKH